MSNNSPSIIVTRPQPYADRFCEQLSEHGFNAIACPLIEFVADLQIDQTQIKAQLESSSALIFISQQAVHYFLEALTNEQVKQLTDKTLIAVGNATGEALRQHNLTPLIPTIANSEGILELVSSLEQINSLEPAEHKFLLVRGNKGRELLAQELRKKYPLTELAVYQRLAIAQQFPELPSPKAILVTSQQLLNIAFERLKQQQTVSLQTSAKSIQNDFAFICGSNRISEQARHMGLTNCYTAQSMTPDNLLAACQQWQTELYSAEETLSNNSQRETMSKQNPEEEIVEALELDKTEAEQQKFEKAIQKKSRKSSPIKFLFWLLLLAALTYGGYWLWQQWQKVEDKNAQETAISQLSKQNQNQQQQIADLLSQSQQTASANQASQQKLQQQLELLQQQLTSSQQKFQGLSNTLNNDQQAQQKAWSLAEAEYLIRQAAQKLHYSDDVSSIVALLKAADQQVLAMGDSNLLALRGAISNDISQIQAAGSLDIDGILVKLDSIEKLIPQLSLASVQLKTEAKTETTQAVEEDANAWQTFKGNIRETFSDYYKIHHYDQSVKPFINPQQATYLEQNLLLNLKMAQLAALRHKQSAYDKAITEATTWVQEYYQQQTASTDTVLQYLAQLSQQSVAIQLPNQLSALSFIKQNSQHQLQNWLQTETITSPIAANEVEETEPEFAEPKESGDIDKTIQNSLERLQETEKSIAEESATEENKQQGDNQ